MTEQFKDDMKKFLGIEPHNTWSNYLVGDPYFAKELEDKYGESIDELIKKFKKEKK